MSLALVTVVDENYSASHLGSICTRPGFVARYDTVRLVKLPLTVEP